MFSIGETSAHIAQECPQFYYVALGLNKNSIYKSIFDQRIQTFKESGLIGKWTKDVLSKAGKISENRRSEVKTRPLSLFEVQGAFWVLIFLSVVCALAFAAEVGFFLIYFKCCFRRRVLTKWTLMPLYLHKTQKERKSFDQFANNKKYLKSKL